MSSEREDEPIVGWRTWNLSDRDTGPVLWPAGSGSDEWPRRRPMEARCSVPLVLTGHRTRHEAPDLDCRCGIHASNSLGVVERQRPAWPPTPVIGRVSLWGRTIAHERGWRAQYAYPVRLGLVCIVCTWMEPGPGTPSVVHSFVGRLYTLCEIHQGGIEVPGGRKTKPTDMDPRVLQGRLLEAYAVDVLPTEPLEELFRRPPAPIMTGYVPFIRVIR